MRMTGSRNTVPTSRKACVDGEDAASHRVNLYGTISGKRLIARPRKDITNNRIAPMNGAASERLLSERHSQLTIGAGARITIWGQANHRSAISGFAHGVHRLTRAMPIRTPINARRPSARAQS